MKTFRTPVIALLLTVIAGSCTRGGGDQGRESRTPFLWDNANIYFLLTDRFMNGDPDNDIQFGRTGETAVMRGFQGGDLAGVIRKIESGYFDELGITALWMTPWVEQIHGSTDEGTGTTYGYHGYWARDWTSLDPNFGTHEELAKLVETAHRHGIRIVMDVVINHTGPVTPQDPVWPDEWVRTSPPCRFNDYESSVRCTLVENLPDIRTGSDAEVDLPPVLLEKWEREGRLDQELAELDAFFERTGYPRAPRYYIIKWLTDFVREYGIDGYRLDTTRHVEESVWKELHAEASRAFEDWKTEHPELVLDDTPFWMVGEVYGYGLWSGRTFDFGDTAVDYFDYQINSLINFAFKGDANQDYEQLFSSYSDQLRGPLKGCGVLNYLTSHDDPSPFDKERARPMEAATKLLLSPGAAQVYYGDESCRNLIIEGASGDATLRGPMNWEQLEENGTVNGYRVGEVRDHYAKLGRFRKEHPAVGAGEHRMISRSPYVFSREFAAGTYSDQVVVALGLDPGSKTIPVGGVFGEGTLLTDHYSGSGVRVTNGSVTLDTPWDLVLLAEN